MRAAMAAASATCAATAVPGTVAGCATHLGERGAPLTLDKGAAAEYGRIWQTARLEDGHGNIKDESVVVSGTDALAGSEGELGRGARELPRRRGHHGGYGMFLTCGHGLLRRELARQFRLNC